MKNLFKLIKEYWQRFASKKQLQSNKTFLSVLQEYFSHISPSKTESTIQKYGYFYKAVERYLLQAKQSNLPISEVRVKTMEGLRSWMHSEKQISREHVSRHIEHCQAAVDYGVLMEYCPHNRIAPIKKQTDRSADPESLELPEVKKYMAAVFKNKTWELVLDLFLFQCFTGLSYMDLWIYEIETERLPGNGEIEFVTSKRGRGKNGKPYAAEFNLHAKKIHNKYQGLFPEISNAYYNRILKQITFSLNIKKNLSTHDARKTYAGLRHRQGMSLEGLADEMGNTPAILRAHYLTNRRDRTKTDIINLNGRGLLDM